jgi:hypothetical protein
MAEMALIESHRFISSASGCSRSPLPVFFLYSLRAASRIELRFEDGVLGDWNAVDEDMMRLATAGLVIVIATSSGNARPCIIWQERQCKRGRQSPGTNEY